MEISAEIAAKSNQVIRQAFSAEENLTRTALIAELARSGIKTDENRASHLLAWAELDRIICSGAAQGKEPTYALLDRRVSKTAPLGREMALARLASRYFTSHGPATLQDFVWWSGLTTGDALQALEMVKPGFTSVTLDSQTYWFANSASSPVPGMEGVHLLPAFDEFIISYSDRTASLPFQNFKKAVSDNGIFRPVIVMNGQVVGVWKRTIKKDKVLVEAGFFNEPDKTIRLHLEQAVEKCGCFLEKETELKYSLWSDFASRRPPAPRSLPVLPSHLEKDG